MTTFLRDGGMLRAGLAITSVAAGLHVEEDRAPVVANRGSKQVKLLPDRIDRRDR